MSTGRKNNEYLDSVLNKKFPLLDHGFIAVMDYMGGDYSVAEAARVSYDKMKNSSSDDNKLIRYLMFHNHTSPFEMCEIKFNIKLPIFAKNQLIRHRTANVNEVSGRYTTIKKEYYIPVKEQMCSQSLDNKQGRNLNDVLSDNSNIQKAMRGDSEVAFDHYKQMVEKSNLSKELSRITLPQNYYTEIVWKIDLHNLLHFLKLRMDSTAQYEIRVYANQIYKIIQNWAPLTCKAFDDYRLNGVMLSKQMVNCINKILDGINVSQENSDLTEREWDYLKSNIDISLYTR